MSWGPGKVNHDVMSLGRALRTTQNYKLGTIWRGMVKSSVPCSILSFWNTDQKIWLIFFLLLDVRNMSYNCLPMCHFYNVKRSLFIVASQNKKKVFTHQPIFTTNLVFSALLGNTNQFHVCIKKLSWSKTLKWTITALMAILAMVTCQSNMTMLFQNQRIQPTTLGCWLLLTIWRKAQHWGTKQSPAGPA